MYTYTHMHMYTYVHVYIFTYVRRYIHVLKLFFCNAQCRQSKQHISSKHCAALSTFQFKEKVVSKIPVLVQVETIGAFAGWYYTIGAYEG